MANQENEKKNKKKGLLFAFFFTGSLIVLAVFPFRQIIQSTQLASLEMMELDEPEQKFTELPTDFEITNSEENRSSRPEPKPMDVPEPTPEPSPQEEPKEVVTDDNVETDPIPQPETPNNNENINPAPPIPSPVPAPTTGGSTTNGNGASDSPSNGKGDVWSDDNGQGRFTRKVTKRDDRIKKLTKKEGTIIVRVAVNRDGRVTAAKYQYAKSTIKHKKMGRAAEHYAKNYRFERDYKVAKTQYCDLTFVFDLDK